MVVLDIWGINFHIVVVFSLGKDLLFKSVLGHCVYFVVVQGLIYSTAKPGQLGHCSTNSMGSPQILWSVRKKGRGFKKGNEITFYARVAIEANKTLKVQVF